jgi:hypothetical protein
MCIRVPIKRTTIAQGGWGLWKDVGVISSDKSTIAGADGNADSLHSGRALQETATARTSFDVAVAQFTPCGSKTDEIIVAYPCVDMQGQVGREKVVVRKVV